MISFYLLLLIPLCWVVVVKFVLHQTISWIESISMLVITAMILSLVYWTGMYSEMRDTQVLNGKVVSKASDRVSCRHSYSCRCRTVRSGKTSSTVCDTCYEHSYDIDWNVETTIHQFKINTIDRQGTREPPRWTSVKVNDSVAVTESFTNYVKAVPDSLFHFNKELLKKFKGNVPVYPLTIYDYYKIDRFVTLGVQVPDIAQWNSDISTALNDIGKSKQANIVVVVTNQPDASYAKALQAAWVGGKKNDVIVVIGTPEYPKVEWVHILSWSKVDLFNVQLRDDILQIGQVDRTLIVPAIMQNINKTYVRKPMKEFEYLREQIEPPSWVIWMSIILSILSLGGLTMYFHKVDLYEMVNGGYGSGYRVNRRRI